MNHTNSFSLSDYQKYLAGKAKEWLPCLSQKPKRCNTVLEQADSEQNLQNNKGQGDEILCTSAEIKYLSKLQSSTNFYANTFKIKID